MAVHADGTEDRSLILELGETVFNLMVLNVLWALCSIPVVTIGASTTALNYTCIKLRKDEGDSVVRMFFRSFAANIRQALILGTGMLAVLIILSAGLIQMIGNILAGKNAYVFAAVALVLLLFLWLLLFAYIFMVLARFDNTLLRTVTNSVYLIIRNPLKSLKILWIEIMLVLVVPYALWTYFPYGFPLVIFFGMPFTAYILSREFNEIFDEYIPEDR